MKTLMLLRHAKSSWDDPSLRDFDRPLNDRGRRDAPRMGKALSKKDPKPDLIVASPAVRAKSTLEAVAKAAGYSCPIEFKESIYGASDAELIRLARAQPDTASTVLLVGHNPGFEELAARLTGKRVEMVTCTVACISFKVEHWNDVEDHQGKLDWLLKPKDL